MAQIKEASRAYHVESQYHHPAGSLQGSNAAEKLSGRMLGRGLERTSSNNEFDFGSKTC